MKFAFTASAAVFGTAIVALGACTSIAETPASEAKAPREYRTGSNIPAKDSAPPATPEERERTAEQIRALQRTGSAGKPGN